ncbi:MAG TPA: DUF2079 domain-containing protein [Candidatus Baltobacteraceae bacterium]|nr:DUF2079 domain-containing protein [Candidatus Baltobacteraceae bacterium]
MRGGRIAWGIAAAYAIVYSWLGIVRYGSYHASCDDGLFVQSIATAFHGFHNTPEGASHFAYHFSPILYVLAPLLWATKSPIALVVVAAVACSLTVPAVYFIARRRLPEPAAVLVALIAALYPALGGISFTDFSENVFAPAAAAWLVWAIDTRRMPLAAIFGLLCLSIKEDQAVILGALGVVGAVYFARRGERAWVWFCLGLSVVSVATITLFMTVVRRATGVWYGYPSIRDFYGGASPMQLVVGLFSAPKFSYVLAILVPLLGICLLSGSILLAVPGLAECLFSRVPITYTMGQHYAAVWVPYVLIAFALGVVRIWRFSPKLAYAALAVALSLNVYIDVAASPNDWSANLFSQPGAGTAMLDDFIATLPQDASITTFCQVYAHLGMHPQATVYATSPTEYVVLYPARDIADWDARERQYLNVAPGYRLLQSADGIEIYRRK